MAYTKLFSSIVTSTIWLEPDETRLVWITMLALADKNGEVQAAIPGLARIAGVSVEACRKAIASFLSPDPDSRTKDEEGRRIEEIQGGWWLINHAKYTRMASLDEMAEKNRERQARHREKVRRNGGVTQSNENVTGANDSVTHRADTHTHTHTHTDTNTNTQSAKPKPKTTKPAKTPNPDFDAFWQAYPRKVGRGAALEVWNKIERPPLETIIKAVNDQSMSKDWTKEDGQYIPHASTWLNQARWEDQLQPVNGTHTKRPLPGQFL